MESSQNAVLHNPALPCLQDQRTSIVLQDREFQMMPYSLNYTWMTQDRKHVYVPAPTYVDFVMTWVQNLLDDEHMFPTKSGTHTSFRLPLKILSSRTAGQEFATNFAQIIKHMYRQLLRIFSHVYHAHYPQILHLRSEPHFNSLFAHFLAFGREYELLDVKDVKGSASAPVGIGLLWERWKEMGILEG